MSIYLVLRCFDVVFLSAIVWCAIDGSRLVKIKEEPWRALAYYVGGVGAFGLLAYPLGNQFPQNLFRVFEDAGVSVLYILHMVRRIQEIRRQRARAQGVEFRRNLKEHIHHG